MLCGLENMNKLLIFCGKIDVKSSDLDRKSVPLPKKIKPPNIVIFSTKKAYIDKISFFGGEKTGFGTKKNCALLNIKKYRAKNFLAKYVDIYIFL